MFRRRIIISIFISLLFISINSYPNGRDRVELANLTVQYYKLLSNKKFATIIKMVDDRFCINGVIHFDRRWKTLNFFKQIYGQSNQTIELFQISVLSYKELQNLDSISKNKLLPNLRNLNAGEWVTMVSNLKVNGKITSSSLILVFKRKRNKWLIKGMYRQNLS